MLKAEDQKKSYLWLLHIGIGGDNAKEILTRIITSRSSGFFI
jgi:hypothetical protein